MQYAKITEGRISRIVESEMRQDGYLPVSPLNKAPDDYPEFFYSRPPTPTFIINKELNVVEATVKFTLKSIDEIKDELYSIQKSIRQQKQLGTFYFGGIPITIKDREDSLIISGLPIEPTNFKIGKAEWIELDIATINDFKSSHNIHVQKAYDWEMAENITIKTLPLEGLRDYVINSKEIN